MTSTAVAFNDELTGLDRNSFAQEFHSKGSTILGYERYALHARKILADERNFLGLFALDCLIQNRQEKFRFCKTMPSQNHPLLLFFVFHTLQEKDKAVGEKEAHLADRPDLDKVLALLHDEGEDIEGFSKEELEQKLYEFIADIKNYIESHNEKYGPHINLPIPSFEEIGKMKNDVPSIIKSFDAITHGYKGEKNKKGYYDYHVDCLEDARAARVKAVDKICNAATFVYRSPELVNALIERLQLSPTPDLRTFRHSNKEFTKYRNWVLTQMSTARNLYFSQKFARPDEKKNRDDVGNLKSDKGFIEAAIRRYPENKRFFKLMKKIMRVQLDLLDHNVANEKQGHDAPDFKETIPEYEDFVFSPRINVLQILRDRFDEVMRIDDLPLEELQKGLGMYNIPFFQKPRMDVPKPKSDNQHTSKPS